METESPGASLEQACRPESEAVGFTTQTDLRQYRQIRQTLLYGAELAKRYVGNESSVTAPGAYYMRDTRVPKAMKNLAALMMDLELIKRDRDDLKTLLAKGSFRRTAEAHYDAWIGLANAALDIADKLPPEMGLSADTMRMFAERIRLQGQWLRATPPSQVGTPSSETRQTE